VDSQKLGQELGYLDGVIEKSKQFPLVAEVRHNRLRRWHESIPMYCGKSLTGGYDERLKRTLERSTSTQNQG
jgi:hypothetical protein